MNESSIYLFNTELCIICQKARKGANVSSTENGRNQIKNAADVRRDIVFHRLSILSNKDSFCYHVNNNCYKNYTHKQVLEKLKSYSKDKEYSVEDESTIEVENVLTVDVDKELTIHVENEACISIENQTNFDVNVSENFPEECELDIEKCIICSKSSYKKDSQLHELESIERAEKLFNATRYFKDDIFTKTAKLTEAKSLIDLQIKYHAGCLRNYEKKFVVTSSIADEKCLINKSLELNNIIFDVIKKIEPKLKTGEIFSLKDVSDIIISIHGEDFTVKYNKIKSCLINYFGNTISFVYSNKKNQSQLFHCCNIEQAIRDYYNKNAIIESANILKQSLNQVDFKLDDKFCDTNDLSTSWKNMSIPIPFVQLLSKLYDCNENVLLEEKKDCSLNNTQCTTERIKSLRLKTLYQIIYFIKNNGAKKTPLHVYIGLFIYTNTKSKITITILNRLGLSISYDEVLRIRTRLAEYATKSAQSIVPLPSHFILNDFITGAFDNLDHNESTISGLNSMHDTAIIIFQNSNDYNKTKLNVSELSIDKRVRSFTTLLKCQQVKNYIKNSNLIELPLTYSINSNHKILTVNAYDNILRMEDYIWILCRLKISECTNELLIYNENQQIPSWSSFHSIVTEDTRFKQTVGYLPMIPSPVTEYATVYTALCNFKDVLDQLEQTSIAITCDEGVYRIARHIQLQRDKEFENIILCLGNFHVIKALLGCIGKYLKNSGVESIFIETNLFGICVTDQLLNGTHYARSVKAFSYLSEALRRLQLREFFTEEMLIKYEQQIIIIENLQDSFQEKNNDEIIAIFTELKKSNCNLFSDFHGFISSRCKESEMFAYWNNVLILISLMHNLIRADRTGDWKLHLEMIHKLQPIFQIFDRVNYSRWCSVYLEDMATLETKAPQVYDEFLKGRFTVKRSDVPFTSVATDQALEQTINRTSKSAGGIIGTTKKKEAVAAWDMTFHELLSICNFFREITYIDTDSDFEIHHEYSNASIKNSESAVAKILCYIEDKKINPFKSGSQPLRNIVTEQLVHSDIVPEILNIFEKGIERYEKFREERFVNRNKHLSAVIPRANLPDFKTLPKSDEPKTGKKKKIAISQTQRVIALANERRYPIQKLLEYDLTYQNILFDENGFLKKENNKSLLSRELEKILSTTLEEPLNNDMDACLVIDVMLVLRKFSWKRLNTFGDLVKSFSIFVKNKAMTYKSSRIDLVFDSYFEKSIKSSEHLRRRKLESIQYNSIAEDTRLPKQEDKFWGSSENKIMLEMFLKNCLLKDKTLLNYKLICSTINNDPCTSNNEDIDQSFLQTLQRFDIEEADVKIITHLNHSVNEGYKNIFLISGDTDVTVLTLYFFKFFKENGLEFLYIEAGTSDSKRIIPVHVLATLHGEELCSVLPTLHHLTGSDYTSKVGTKLSALQASPTKYLAGFGMSLLEANIDRDIKNAEEYLIQVLKKKSPCKTFNELRLWSYHHSKCALVEDLPPTSSSIKLHILRSFYIVYTQTNCLDMNVTLLDPTQYGFIVEDDLLMPQQVQILLPPSYELVSSCPCKVCSRKTCVCVAAEIACCSYCSCQRNNTCKNVFNDKNSTEVEY